MIVHQRIAAAIAAGVAWAIPCVGYVSAAPTNPHPETVVTYSPSSQTIANPERGFYHHTGDCDKSRFDPVRLEKYRTEEKVTLVMCIFYLARFKTSAIDGPTLAMFDSQAAAVRKAGLKMILRFAYTASEAGDDAPLARVQSHLDQLAPYLRRNSDVIDVVQSGFVGAWGEGYYTQNFGNKDSISADDWANRKAVVDKLLSVLPNTRMVQLRTPTMKRQMYGLNPIAPAAAYNGSPLSRIGHHNDCFLASQTDFGTYKDPDVEYPYLQADTRYAVMGGETCNVNPPRSQCPTAMSELNAFHWSYLNKDYKRAVLDSWVSCKMQVEQRLGYRFSLVRSEFPPAVTRGTAMPLRISVKNTGFASPHNLRPVVLILRHTDTGLLWRTRLSSDPRQWSGGVTTTVTQNFNIPATLPAGTYALLLSLPDGSPALASQAAYAIQMANSVGVWEQTTGFNRLLTTVQVKA
jgi:hypothetical protein